MISKEEIARVDRVHRRADEAVEQIKAGHIITSCIVLYPEENNGTEVKWTAEALETWPGDKEELIHLLSRVKGHSEVTIFVETAWHCSHIERLVGKFLEAQQQGRVMYRNSAAYLALHPSPDPYTKSDRSGDVARSGK